MIQTRCAPSLPPPDAPAESSEREKEKGGWRGDRSAKTSGAHCRIPSWRV